MKRVRGRGVARTLGIALTLGALLALPACGSDDESSDGAAGGSATTSADKKVNLAMLAPANGAYFNPQIEAFKATAEANNATATVYVANYDTAKQSSQCQTAISLGKYQGILTYAVNNAALTPCAKQAIAKGIKVVNLTNALGPDFLSTEIQVEGVSGQVVVPYAKEAQATVDLVQQACEGNDSCEVALLVGDPAGNYSSGKAKIQTEGLEKLGIKVVAAVKTGFDSPAVGISNTKSLLGAHPGLDVVVADDDSNLLGIVKEQEAGRIPKSLKLVGDGGRKEALALVKDGSMFGTIYYPPRSMATMATDMLLKATRDQPIENNNITMDQVGPKVLGVTKDNIDDVTPEW